MCVFLTALLLLVRCRRKTRLPDELQKRVVRAIKAARCMALIAGEARLEKRDVRRIREQERKQEAWRTNA
jgi:hypothetical protein